MLENITPGRQGRLRTNLSGKLAYQSFLPSPLQEVLPLELNNSTNRVISDCRALLGEMQGMAQFVPNIGMYLTMYVRKEALLSSQIEGTQCTFDDVLDPTLDKNASRDLSEVINYVKATERATELMQEMPLCTRLLREVHEVLLADVRGSDKQPGTLRTTQNWVGPAGCTINDASYVPPNVEDMQETLSDLEVFLNEEDSLDPIAKTALAHYQLETAHPFLDGNGRVGRLLITLSLMNDGVIDLPVIYPSYELKRRRSAYYDWLMRVRETGDFEGWVGFFCECLLESAQDARNSMRELAKLHERTSATLRISTGRGLTTAMRLLELLEGNPIVDTSFVAEHLSMSKSGANSLVGEFVNQGILVQRDSAKRRYRTFSYEAYLEILRSGDEPL